MKTSLFILLALLLCTSCKKEEEQQPFEPIKLEQTLIGGGSLRGNEGIEKENCVIESTEEWNNLLARIDSTSDISDRFHETEIDFNTYTVLAVFEDVKPCTGYILHITEVNEQENQIVASIELTGPGGLEFYIITQPFYIVKIEKQEKEIVFINEEND